MKRVFSWLIALCSFHCRVLVRVRLRQVQAAEEVGLHWKWSPSSYELLQTFESQHIGDQLGARVRHSASLQRQHACIDEISQPPSQHRDAEIGSLLRRILGQILQVHREEYEEAQETYYRRQRWWWGWTRRTEVDDSRRSSIPWIGVAVPSLQVAHQLVRIHQSQSWH